MFSIKSSKNNYLNNLLFFLLCIIPAALVTGPFIPDFIIFIFLFIFFFFFKIKFKFFFEDIYLKTFFFFWICVCISSIMSTDIIFSMKTSFFHLRFFLFSFFCGYIIFYNKYRLVIFFKILLFTLTFFLLDALFQYFFGYNILGYEQKIENRIGGLFNEKLVAGSYLSKLYPIFLALFFFINNKLNSRWKLFFFTICFAVTLVIFLSGERASFYHHVIFLLIIFFLSNKKKYLVSHIRIFFILPILLILVFINLNPKIKERVFSPIINISVEKNIFTSYHLAHFYSAYKIFLDNKIIGIGPKMFRKHCNEDRYSTKDSNNTNLIDKNPCSTHPHNTYIQILAEGGLLSFFIILFLYSVVVLRVIKHFYFKFIKKKFLYNNYELSILVAIFVYFFPLSTNGNFFNNWLNVFLSLYLAFNYFFLILNKNK